MERICDRSRRIRVQNKSRSAYPRARIRGYLSLQRDESTSTSHPDQDNAIIMQSAREIESTRLLRRDSGRDRVNAGRMHSLTEVKSEQPGG